MDGPAEALLEDLLKNSKAQTEILKKLAGAFKPASTGGPGGPGNGGLSGLAAAATEATKQFNPMIKAITMVADLLGSFSAGIGAIIGGIADLGGHLFDLAKKAAEGKARLHDLFDAFADLPLGIGKLASIFSSMIKVSEGLLDTYRPLTESGASFGGVLIAVSNMATRAGLTLDEFQKVVKTNSQTFASMGGSVADGMMKFADANSNLVGPNSKFKEAIFGMGYTAEQASQMLMTMTKGQGAMGRAGAATSEQLAKYTAEYMTQLDELTKITGKQRDQIDQAVKKAEEEQLWQSFKDSLGPEAAKRVTEALASAQAMGGEELVKVVKNQLRGIDAPLDEASTNMAITTGGMSVQMGNLVRGIISGSTSIGMLNQQFQGLGNATMQFADAIGPQGTVYMTGLVNQALAQTGRNIKNMGEAEAKARNDQLKSAISEAAKLGNAEQSLKLTGINIMNMFYKILAPFNSIILDISNALLGTVGEKLGPMGEAVNNVVTWLTGAVDYIKEQFSGKDGSFSKGFTAIWDKLVEGLGKLWEKIGPPITATWHDKIEPWLIKAFTNLFDMMMTSVKNYVTGGPVTEQTKNKETIQRQGQDLSGKWDNWGMAIDLLGYHLGKIVQFVGGGSGIADMYTHAYLDNQKDMLDELVKQGKILEQHGKDAKGNDIITGYVAGPNRASGSLGATGNLFENWGKETAVNLHGTESVVTPEQMGRIISGAGQNTLSDDLKQLNTLTQQLLNYMKQTADNTRRTHDATRALSGNMLEAF
jgi:hypothetical protein